MFWRRFAHRKIVTLDFKRPFNAPFSLKASASFEPRRIEDATGAGSMALADPRSRANDRSPGLQLGDTDFPEFDRMPIRIADPRSEASGSDLPKRLNELNALAL